VAPGTWDEQGEFITAFEEHHTTRWINGRFSDPRIRVYIHLDHDDDSWNRVHWTIDPDAFPSAQFTDILRRLFDAGNHALRPFYAISDTEANVNTKAKKSGYGVDYQEELSGVFWLTYFNNHYCDFFGHETLAAISEAEFPPRGGVRLQLGKSPFTYRQTRRLQIERKLGSASFVDSKSRREKERGDAVLTFAQLRRRRKRGSSTQ
jgi:hypothetical protein